MKSTPDDPNVDDEDPKIVSKSCRIFQPKDENVSSEDDGIDEEDKLIQDSATENKLPKADFFVQRTKRKSRKQCYM